MRRSRGVAASEVHTGNPERSPRRTRRGLIIISGLTIVIIRTGRNDDDERHINGHTAVSGYRVRTLHSTDSSGAGENHLGSRASGMQGSLGTGTAWPYYCPASRTLRQPWRGVVESYLGGIASLHKRWRHPSSRSERWWWCAYNAWSAGSPAAALRSFPASTLRR